ncbi:MAG: hypothetical protein RSF94_07645 [Rikenellaceae bacterium]
MRKSILIISILLCVGVLFAGEPQRKGRKRAVEVEKEAIHVSKHRSTVYMDISSKKVEYRTIKYNVDKKLRSGCDTLYITVFSNTGAAVRCTTFENLGDPKNLFVKSASITPTQLSSIVTNGVKTKIVIVINLFKNNTRFQSEIGHDLFSDEGMRFVDDYLKQVFYNNNIKHCRINTNCSSKQQKLFVDPLVEELKDADVNVILNSF